MIKTGHRTFGRSSSRLQPANFGDNQVDTPINLALGSVVMTEVIREGGLAVYGHRRPVSVARWGVRRLDDLLYRPRSALMEEEALEVIDEVGETDLGLGANVADGPDEQPHAVLLMGKDMLDPGADDGLPGVGPGH